MEEWIEFDEPSAQRAVAALGRALPWIDLAVAACALVSIILTAFFGFDLGLSGLGVLVKIAAVLTTLAAPLWFLGRALQLLIARQSSRRSAFARAIGVVAVIALNAAMLRSDLPAKSFVWRRMDEFEAIVRGEKDTAKSAYGVTRYKGRIVIRYPMWDNWLDTFNVVYDPSRTLRLDGDEEDWIWHRGSIESVRHLWGPWYSAIY